MSIAGVCDTRGSRRVDERPASETVLCIFQLPTINGVRARVHQSHLPYLVPRKQRRAENAGADTVPGETDDRARAQPGST